MPNPYTATGDITFRLVAYNLITPSTPHGTHVTVASPERIADLDAAELAAWERDLEANLYVQLKPHVRSMPACERERDCERERKREIKRERDDAMLDVDEGESKLRSIRTTTPSQRYAHGCDPFLRRNHD